MKTFPMLSLFCIILQQQIQFVQSNAADDTKTLESIKQQKQIETAKRDRLILELNETKTNVKNAKADLDYQLGISIGETNYTDRDGRFKLILTTDVQTTGWPNLDSQLSKNTPKEELEFTSEGMKNDSPFYMTPEGGSNRYAIVFIRKAWTIINALTISDIDFFFNENADMNKKYGMVVAQGNIGQGEFGGSGKSLDGAIFLPAQIVKAKRIFGATPPVKDKTIVVLKSKFPGQYTEYLGNYKQLTPLYMDMHMYKNDRKEKVLYFNAENWHISDSKNIQKLTWEHFIDTDINEVNTSFGGHLFYRSRDAWETKDHWKMFDVEEGYRFDVTDFDNRLEDFEREEQTIQDKVDYVDGFVNEYVKVIANFAKKGGASH